MVEAPPPPFPANCPCFPYPRRGASYLLPTHCRDRYFPDSLQVSDLGPDFMPRKVTAGKDQFIKRTLRLTARDFKNPFNK